MLEHLYYNVFLLLHILLVLLYFLILILIIFSFASISSYLYLLLKYLFSHFINTCIIVKFPTIYLIKLNKTK